MHLLSSPSLYDYSPKCAGMGTKQYIWKTKDEEVFGALVHYMKDHLVDPLTLNSLAREATMNEDKLKKGFHHFFGTTVHQYLFRIRMDRAYELVNGTDKPFKEIASLVGYRPRNFFHCFKKYFGQTPGQLRAKKAAQNSHN
jgi:AraC family transcriptional regulator, transcriptional activator of the genes for pyochelin and ferripyochelin receptors